MRIQAAAFLLGLVCVAACSAGPERSSSTAPAAEKWLDIREPLFEDYLKAHPVAAVINGRHEYDGVLPDWSAEAIAAEIKRLHAARDRAMAVDDTSLDENTRLERDNFVARLDRDLV